MTKSNLSHMPSNGRSRMADTALPGNASQAAWPDNAFGPTDSPNQFQGQWYLVAAKPRSEDLAKVHLSRQSYVTCLPTISLRKRRRGQWQQVTEPMFPGYVFVALTLGIDDIAPIRSTIGCRGLVRFGGELVPVPQAVMTPFLAFDTAPMTKEHRFRAGDKLMIEDGPFAGLEAIFDMPKGEQRVQVLIEMLGELRAVSVLAANVGPA